MQAYLGMSANPQRKVAAFYIQTDSPRVPYLAGNGVSMTGPQALLTGLIRLFKKTQEPAVVITNSDYIWKTFTQENLQLWKEGNFLNTPKANKELVTQLAQTLLEYPSKVEFRRPQTPIEQQALQEATKAAKRYLPT